MACSQASRSSKKTIPLVFGWFTLRLFIDHEHVTSTIHSCNLMALLSLAADVFVPNNPGQILFSFMPGCPTRVLSTLTHHILLFAEPAVYLTNPMVVIPHPQGLPGV